jgi:hypothetical protein
MTWAFDSNRKYTLVRLLVVNDVPSKAHVAVSCKGRGCPRGIRTATAAAGKRKPHKHKKPKKKKPGTRTVDLTRLFKGRHLRPGAKITVTISQPGYTSKVYTFVIRAGRGPLISFN